MIVTIQSAKRPTNVKCMEDNLFPLKPIWIVPKDCVKSYVDNGAQDIIGIDGEYPLKTKQLNYALDLGEKNNEIVVTMDDDFQFCKKVFQNGDKKVAIKIPFHELILEMVERLKLSDYNLAGISPSTNLFFKDTEVQYHGMVTGQLLFHKPNKLRFDENCNFLEDLEFVLAHHKHFNGILRYNYYCIGFHMYGRSEKENSKYQGGFDGLRNEEEQVNILKYIQEKYDNTFIKFPEKTEVGKSLTRLIKWKKIVNHRDLGLYLENNIYGENK